MLPSPKFKILLVFFVAVSPVLTWADDSKVASYPTRVGKAHPPIIGYSVAGDAILALDSFRGKKVLLIHFAPWMPESHKVVAAWAERTRKWVADGKLAVLGVVQEQHRDRADLFAQWKELPFPVIHDVLNQAGVGRLPCIVGLDENGHVRVVDPELDEISQAYVKKKFKLKKNKRAPLLEIPNPRQTQRNADEARQPKVLRGHADALFLANQPPLLDEAIRIYGRVLRSDPSDAMSHFRLGVAHRMRFDSAGRHPGDFQAAVDAWREAARLDPKNAVFAGRIQQYGLRFEKPHAFYRWIKRALSDLAKADRPMPPLSVALSSIERAKPSSKFKASSSDASAPDDVREDFKAVDIEYVVIPATHPKKRRYAQVLMIFRPTHGTWTTDGPAVQAWLDAPSGVKLSRRHVKASRADAAGDAALVLNVEVRLPKGKKKTSVTIEGAAVCSFDGESDDAKCPIKFTVDLGSKRGNTSRETDSRNTMVRGGDDR